MAELGIRLKQLKIFFALIVIFVVVTKETAAYQSSHGRHCVSKCQYSSKGYYSCQTEKTPTWSQDSDFCSPAAGVDYRSITCSTLCAYNGKTAKWCNLQGGGWGWCSTFSQYDTMFVDSQISRNTIISTYGVPCKSECKSVAGCYRCDTVRTIQGRNWDNCSPAPHRDTYNRECSSPCVFNGYAYKTCHINGHLSKC